MSSRDTIFVSVVSYCDPMLGFTLASIRAQAADPSRIYIGAVDQAVPGAWLHHRDEWSREHVRTLRVHALEARGPCWARALAMGLYQGESWYLQVDSHTWFEPGWDERLVRRGQQVAAARHARTMLTCYPNPFAMRDGQPTAQPVTQCVLAHVVKTDAEFSHDHPVLMFECVGVETQEPVAGIHVAGGCLFAPGRLVEAVPYDPYLYFHGEEQSFALRAWTRGWDIFHVPGMPMYHLYTQPGEQPRPMHWSPELDRQRAVRSAALEEAARKRLTALLWEGADLGVYGLGHERSLADYAAFSGIDYGAHRIEPRARKMRFGY